MLKKFSSFIRNITLVLVILAFVITCGIQLLQIQIVDGESYLNQSVKNFSETQPITATRGNIIDSKGVLLNSSKVEYKLVLQRAFLVSGTENEIIAKVLEILINEKQEWNESLPITREAPYQFLPDSEREVEKLKNTLDLAVYATVDNCMENLIEQYEISDDFSPEMQRLIAGVRYEMTIKDFSYKIPYVLADDVSYKVITQVKEQSFYLGGVDAVEESTRKYDLTTTAPHIRGTMGKVSQERYEQLLGEGVDIDINDMVGTDGIEKHMEKYLRGTNGVRTITRYSNGETVDDEITTPPQAGNTVKLTIDSKFQTQLQEILENQIKWLNGYTNDLRGINAFAGAVVVLDVKNGGVLGAATYPSYDIDDLLDDYYKVLEREHSPLTNRAIFGEYRPGSTFKTITSAAALGLGIVSEHDTIVCNHSYTFFPDYQPNCHSTHGSQNVRLALRNSCNIYYYDTARRMGIDNLSRWASMFGVGQDLKLEIGGSTGQMTSIDLYEKLGVPWNPGDILQAGIGQSETLMTPMHLAVQAMTLANKGVRYRPHLVEGIYDYNGEELIEKIEPIIDENIEGFDHQFEVIKEGMIMVSDAANWNGRNIYAEFSGKVATKTGTPQVTKDTYNSAIVGYYPADDPEIAFGVLIEKGEFSRHVVVNLIRAYTTGEYKPVTDGAGKITSPF